MDSRLIPDLFGDYIPLRDQGGAPIILGSGGFGTTILAYRSRTIAGEEIRDDCAIKILHQQAIQDPKRRRQFIAEIRALRDLHHPNLVRYVDCGETNGLIFLVMELCRGGDLEKFVTDLGRFRERTALEAVSQVCDGLKEAHRKNYLHRDLKPRNVLLLESVPPTATADWFAEAVEGGRLSFKVVDFGLAGRLGSDVRTSGFAGSPMFCSPEQVRERDLDFRSDIYSLGITLWYLVAGRGPLLRADGRPVEDSREAMKLHTSPQPHDPSFPPHLSAEFRKILSRMVRKSPEDRFGSLRELSDALKRVLESGPAMAEIAAPPEEPEEPVEVSLVDQPDWAVGECDDFYSGRTECGRRSIGKFYRATSNKTKQAVGLTAWVPGVSPDAMTEHQLAKHLERIKKITSSGLAPPSLTPISEVRRTAGEWCVAEEWQDGVLLEELVARRGRSLSIEEIALLLMPVAEASDFLLRNDIHSALLTISDIRLCGAGLSTQDQSWLQKPVERWEDWSVQVSALAVPPELSGNALEQAPALWATLSSSLLTGTESFLPIGKAFCRLFYRMGEGSDVAGAADWDEHSYTEANRLSAASNVLLRRAICGADEVESVSDLLRRICANEGVYRLPEASTVTSKAARTTGTHPGLERPSPPPGPPVAQPPVVPVAKAPAPPPTPSVPPPAKATPRPPAKTPPPTPPPASTAPPLPLERTIRGVEAIPPPASAEPNVTKVVRPGGRPPIMPPTVALETEVAQLVSGTVGLVRSPYGSRREQRVSGPHWRVDAKIYCEETNRLFKLPRELPALDALIIEGRYDAVLSPYVEPPREVPVPLGRWKSDGEITCDITGLPLHLPEDLPVPDGVLVPETPGVVRSPYADHREVPVPPERWRPGERFSCPASGQMFTLPTPLPPLHALLTDIPGCFTSPYAPDQRFTLQPAECVAGFEFACPASENPLAVPPNLPPTWKFEGLVRQSEVPEARSPFIVGSEADFWQPLLAAQWKPGAPVRCVQTGREFLLPRTLPLLAVTPAPNPPAVLSPFSPHDPVAIPIAEWQPGAEVTITLGRGARCRVVLPQGQLPPLVAVPGEVAGEFSSPYAPDRNFALPAWECLPGAPLPCPFTERSLILPAEMPAEWRWEAMVRQTRVPEAKSPFVRDESQGEQEEGKSQDENLVQTMWDVQQVWQPLSEAEWSPGGAVLCRSTGKEFFLPADLPVLRVEAGPVPPSVLSPFAPHESIAVPPDSWRRSAEIEVRLSSGIPCRIILPDHLLPIGRADLAELATLPLGFDAQVRSRRGAIRSPHGDQPWVDVPAKEWRCGMRLVCPATEQPFWLPEELPPLEARIGSRPGSVWSPYTDRAVEIPPSRWQSGEAIQCAESGGWFVLPSELPLLTGRVDENRPGFVESPFAPGDFFRVEVPQWVPAGTITCPRTGRNFALPEELPEWIVEVEIVAPALGMVRSPYAGRVAFKVTGEQWETGALVTCPQTNRGARLPGDLPPMEAILIEERPGFIESPYDSPGNEQKIRRGAWHPSGLVRCEATGRPMRLPEKLPPLPKATVPVGALVGVGMVALCIGVGIALMLNRPVATVVSSTPTPIVPPPEKSEIPFHSIAINESPPKHIEPPPPSTPPPTPPPPPPQVWPRKFTFGDGISPTPEKILLISEDTGDSLEVSRRVQGGLRVEVDLEKAMRESRYANARSLRLELVKPGYNNYSVRLERSADGVGGLASPVSLERQTGTFKATGQRPPPFYSAIRTVQLEGSPLDPKQAEHPLQLETPIELKTGRYKVELIADRSKIGGIEVADRPVGEVVIDATKPAELKLLPFEIPRMLAGYVRIDWRDYDSKTFRPLGDATPPGEVKNFKWSTWSPVVVVLDESFTKGELYEAHNLVTSQIVDAFNTLFYTAFNPSAKIDPQTASTIKDNAAGLLSALNLPADPTPELVIANEGKLERAAEALWKCAPADSDPRVQNARKSYPYFLELISATRKPAWTRLVQACVGTGSVPLADLQELAKPAAGKKLGYLVRSKFTVRRCEAGGALELSVQRHSILGKLWDSNDPEDWNPALRSSGAAASRFPWTLSGKWLGDPCNIELREITAK
ncbi:MAG: eukaryotic-like serine/threonine-protein kinase [Chthoniobacter sp.]|jgi:hypothetical protein|nr:eukaryotic-like serine/threonine-protein kinase [Chthoniobacter sp.]